MFSDAYVECLSAGPFPGRIDPWAEAGRYFHQIHGSMIGDLLERLRLPLMKIGYVASRETSLQVAERSQPDVAVRGESPEPVAGWNYAAAAAEILVEPGVAVEGDVPELEAVYIKRLDMSDLVTIVEIISPSNKADNSLIRDYTERRERLIRGQAVNVVELDLTRSVKRLLRDFLVRTYSYHIAVHLPHELPRVVGLDFGQPLKSFALPLRNQVIAVETQAVYDTAYQQASIAAQMDRDGGYVERNLPFPSLLTEAQRGEALDAVRQWQETLSRLRTEQT